MAIALDPKTPIRFVLPDDRDLDEEDQTVWLIKPLLRSEMLKLLNEFEALKKASTEDDDGSPDREGVKQHMAASSKLLLTYIVGWENFKTADGEEVKFVKEKGRSSDKNLDYIPMSMYGDLLNGIFQANSLDEIELKN